MVAWCGLVELGETEKREGQEKRWIYIIYPSSQLSLVREPSQ